MKPVKFEGHNTVFGAHQLEYYPLPAYYNKQQEDGKLICCWQLTWRERLKLLFTGKIWHHIQTFNQPLQPQFLDLDYPFNV